jgi:hypothetical protein
MNIQKSLLTEAKKSRESSRQLTRTTAGHASKLQSIVIITETRLL